MMSAAVMLMVGGEQAKTSSVMSGKDGNGELSFAQSLGERMGLLGKGLPVKSSEDVLNELREGKSVEIAKVGDEALAVLEPSEGKMIANQIVPTLERSKELIGHTSEGPKLYTNLISHEDLLSREQSEVDASTGEALVLAGEKKSGSQMVGSHTKQEASQVSAKDESSAGSEENATAALSFELNALPKTGDMNANHLLRDGKDVVDASLSSHGPAGQEALITEKNQKVIVEKKSEKAPERKVSPKTDAVAGATREVAGGSVATGFAGAAPMLDHASAVGDGERGENGITAKADSQVADTVEASMVMGSGGPRKTVEKTGKGPAEDEIIKDASPAADSIGPTGFEAKISHALEIAVSEGKSGSEKTPIAVGGTSSIHGAGGVDGVGTGIVSGVIAGREGLGAGGTKVQAAEISSPSAGEKTGPSVISDEAVMSHRTLLATPTSLEVGVTNGTQGWLKIRAEMTDGGEVNASLSTSSLVGQDMLHRDLPALTAYLHEERVAVNAVIVHAGTGAESRSGGGGMEGDGRGHAQQSQRQEGRDDRERDGPLTIGVADDGLAYADSLGVGEDGLLLTGKYAAGGGWLNVRA